jgi:hypothetical protein
MKNFRESGGKVFYLLVAVTYATHEINWETALRDSMAIYLKNWGHSNPKFAYKGSQQTACVSHQDGIFGVDFLDPDLKEQILVEVQEDGDLRHLSFFLSRRRRNLH